MRKMFALQFELRFVAEDRKRASAIADRLALNLLRVCPPSVAYDSKLVEEPRFLAEETAKEVQRK